MADFQPLQLGPTTRLIDECQSTFVTGAKQASAAQFNDICSKIRSGAFNKKFKVREAPYAQPLIFATGSESTSR